MGDFSRDPNERLADSISKHYVGVRLQQGVPILDADWNELEDIRKHEVQEFIKQFIGDCVPDTNNGFRIESLSGGGVGTIVLQVISSVAELTTIEVVLGMSTSANILGFLPGNTYSERFGSSPAILTGNAIEPFALVDGSTFTVRVNGGLEQTVTFSASDFADIGQATAAEIISVLSSAFGDVNIFSGTGSDFIINGGGGSIESAGRMLVEGAEVFIENNINHTAQSLYENTSLAQEWGVDIVPALDPLTGVDRQDIVYLDVWEREVGFEEDESIIQPVIGIETAKRLRREWAIRVASGATDLSGIARNPGHKYTSIARLRRIVADGDAINVESIIDLRRTNINLARYLKTPINIVQGQTVLTAQDFAEVLEVLRSILIQRFQQRIFIFSFDDLYDFHIIRLAMEEILTFSAFAAMQARTGNYNNSDGLMAFNEIYRLQQEFVRAVDEFGNVGGVAQTFIDEYDGLLNGPGTSLNAAHGDDDLIAVVDAQEAINEWLNEAVRDLPSGSVLVVIRDVDPASNLAFDEPFNVTYEIESRVVSSREREVFEIRVDTELPTPWEYNLNRSEITLDSSGGRGTVVLTVTPRAGAANTQFRLTVSAARNDEVVTFTHISSVFQISLPPITEEFLQWRVPELDEDGRIPFSQADFIAGAGQVDFQVNLINTSDTVTQRYRLVYFVIPPAGEEADWHPNEAESTPTEILINTGDMHTSISSIFGPTTPAIDTEGTLVVEATLIEEDGAPPAESRSALSELTFVVTP